MRQSATVSSTGIFCERQAVGLDREFPAVDAGVGVCGHGHRHPHAGQSTTFVDRDLGGRRFEQHVQADGGFPRRPQDTA